MRWQLRLRRALQSEERRLHDDERDREQLLEAAEHEARDLDRRLRNILKERELTHLRRRWDDR